MEARTVRSRSEIEALLQDAEVAARALRRLLMNPVSVGNVGEYHRAISFVRREAEHGRAILDNPNTLWAEEV